jgi:hypothetical protein
MNAIKKGIISLETIPFEAVEEGLEPSRGG